MTKNHENLPTARQSLTAYPQSKTRTCLLCREVRRPGPPATGSRLRFRLQPNQPWPLALATTAVNKAGTRYGLHPKSPYIRIPMRYGPDDTPETRRERDPDESAEPDETGTRRRQLTGHPERRDAQRHRTPERRDARGERKSAGVRGGEGSRDRARWRDPRPGRADGSCTVQLYAHRSAVHHSSNHISAGGEPPNATRAMIAHWTPP